MGYGSKSLNDLRDEAYRIARSHGFHEEKKSIGDFVALFHSEVSELFEDYRAGLPVDEVHYVDVYGEKQDHFWPPGVDKPRKPCGIPSEAADILIRVLDFCGAHGIDIERVVREKMLFNESRPHKHGKVI